VSPRLLPALIVWLVVASFASADFDPATGRISDARWKSGVPLGGIGVGAVEVLTDGAFGRATINHNWDRPTGLLRGSFAAIRTQSGDRTCTRLLRLAQSGEYAGVANIAHTSYLGLYPRAEVRFDDPELPIEVQLQAYSPLIPRNVKDSSLPVAFLDYTLHNPTGAPIEAALALSWENLLGFGGRREVKWDSAEGNSEAPLRVGGMQGLRFSTTQSYSGMQQNTVGEYFLGVEAEGVKVTLCPSWDSGSEGVGFYPYFEATGQLAPLARKELKGRPAGAVCASVTLAPGETRVLRFLLAWNMPWFRMEREEKGPTGRFLEHADAGRAACDGDLKTRWTSNSRPMKVGDQFTLDLGSAVPVQGVVLDSSPSPNDYPRGYVVEASTDGRTWKTLAQATREEADAAQQGAVLTVRFSPTLSRFLRITNQGNETTWCWSIHEVRVLGPEGALDLTRAKTSDRVAEVATRRHLEDVGHYHSNSLASVAEVVAYAQAQRERLLRETSEWQDQISASSLPFWLKLKLINCAFTMYSDTVLTRDGRFAVMESPIDMNGALGTMDQRMAAHGFYTQMFPELDKAELELFLQCQQSDGRITHFDGNFHEVIGDPAVGYGVTDWPDLSSAWVLQVLKEYCWTGDRAFLDKCWPGVKKALAWLQSADKDGDLIPEGGSTYDYEQLPRGAFVYSASCYLGALLGAEAIAQVEGDAVLARAYRDRFEAVQRSVMKRLWNGRFFIKWRSGTTEAVNPNSFVAALAGDWLAHLCGLRDTLPRTILDRETEQLLARHLQAFYPVPPMEVTEDGRLATSSCFMLQHEPYLGCEALYRGFADDGLEVLRRVYYCAWEKNRNPWEQSLCYTAPGGAQGGLRTYMTCPTTYHVLNALSGITLDVPAKTLFVSPRLPSDLQGLHLPVFLADFWGWLDYVPAKHLLRFTVTKALGDAPHEFTTVARDGNATHVLLPAVFRAQTGAVLDLSPWITALAPFPTSRQVTVAVPKPSPAQRPGLSPVGWQATAISPAGSQESATEPQLAFDGDPTTRWTTGRGMKPGDWFVLDLGHPERINRVWADVAASPEDYPRGYEIGVSLEGTQWKTVAEADEGTSRRSVRHGVWRASFTPVEARFVRITQRGSHDHWWWSMHELYVLPENYQAPINRSELNVHKKRIGN